MFRIPFSVFQYLPIKNITDRLTEGVIPIFVLNGSMDDTTDRHIVSETNVEQFLEKLDKHDHTCSDIATLFQYIEKQTAPVKNKVLFLLDGGISNNNKKIVSIFQKYNYPIAILLKSNYVKEVIQWNEIENLTGVTFVPCGQNLAKEEKSLYEINDSIKKLKKELNTEELPFYICSVNSSSQMIDELKMNSIKIAFTEQRAHLSLNELERNDSDQYKLPVLDFPISNREQNGIINKFACVNERQERNTLKKLFETSYGLRRQVASNLFEYYFLRRRYVLQSRNIDITRVKRLIFICIGNICRSPFAEVVASSYCVKIPVISMGIEASGVDSPDPKALKVAKEFGYDMSMLCSTKIKRNEITDEDLLIVMEISHLKRLEWLTNEINCQATLLGAWDDKPTTSINDPYGLSTSRFRSTFSHIKTSTRNLVSHFTNNNLT